MSHGNNNKQARKQTVGVDLRLVVIAALVVGMLLIQLVLVESYPSSNNNMGGRRQTHFKRPSLSLSLDARGNNSSRAKELGVSSSPMHERFKSFSTPEIDIESLERQLNELQAMRDGEDTAMVVADVNSARNQLPPPMPDTYLDEPPPPLPPPTGRSSSSSHAYHHPHHYPVQLKSCKSRLHLFKSYKSPPAIVYFPPKDDSAMMAPWKQVMLGDFGFKETANPALASFLISHMLLSSQICPDSQVFNHLRGFKTALKTMVIWRHALVFSPPSSSSSSSSSAASSTSSASSKRQQCSAFIAKLDALLRNTTTNSSEETTLVHAEFVKSTISTKQVSREELKRMVDAYKRTGLCAMQSDETVRVQVFEIRALRQQQQQYVAVLPVYVATTKPWMVFAATSHVTIRPLVAATTAAVLSVREFQTEQALGFSQIKRLLNAFKAQLGGAIAILNRGNSKLQEQLATQGRFGYFAIEFLLLPEADGFKPAMLRVVDHNEEELIREVVSSQLQLLKRTWFAKTSGGANMMLATTTMEKSVPRPEELKLHAFELCAYEQQATAGLRIFPFEG